MRALAATTYLLAATACFDFTATQQADLGGRCGDLDHYCASGLACRNDVCVRDTGSEAGELCNNQVRCRTDLVCVANVCFVACDTLSCGDHGRCVQGNTGPTCLCDTAYVQDETFCASDRGTACSANGIQRCATGLVCLNERCAEPCENAYCEHGTRCEKSLAPNECRCAFGFTLEADECVDACVGKACSSVGTCMIAADGSPTCNCGDSGLVPSGTDCIDPKCITPVSHAKQICVSNRLYWFNSCGKQEDDIADYCGARGCVTGALECTAFRWDNRDVTFPSDAVRSSDFELGADGHLVAAAGTNINVLIMQYTDAWRPWSSNAGSLDTGGPVTAIGLAIDSSQKPHLALAASRMLYARWNGSAWEGLSNSDAADTGIDTLVGGQAPPGLIVDAARKPTITWVPIVGFPGFSPALKFYDGDSWESEEGKTLLPGSPAPFSRVGVGTYLGARVVAFGSGATDFQARVLRFTNHAWTDIFTPFAYSGAKVGFVAKDDQMVLATAHTGLTNVRIWANSAFTDKTLVAVTSGLVSNPDVAMNAGNIFVAWQEGADSIYVRRYVDNGWETVGDQSKPGGLAEGATSTVGAPVLRVTETGICIGWRNGGVTQHIRCGTL